jgi:hypothetical protein
MLNKTIKAFLPILVVLAIVLVGSEGFSTGKRGQLISQTWAMETGHLEKEAGENVILKAKVKNTGDANATYIIAVEIKEHGTDYWEPVGLEDMTLSPGEYSEILVLGTISCTESMEGKYYDIRFVLYDAETEAILDQKYIPEAFNVTSTLPSGTIAAIWIE